MAWQNGRIPLSELTPLGWPEADHLRLRDDAAKSLWRVAWRFELRFGKPLFITDAYRDYDTQVRLKKQKGPFAATPGTSNHGWGVAIDAASRINVDGSEEHDWFVREARAHGWVWPTWASDYNPANGQHEPWHMEYHPELDTRKGELNDAFPLRRGSTGFRVIAMQRRLGLAVDGILGTAGETAVKNFQRSRKLTPDGLVGPATWRALFEPSEEEQIMSVKDDIVAELKAFIRAEVVERLPVQVAFKLPGTKAWYRPAMGFRQWIRDASGYEAVELPVDNEFWTRPVLGLEQGEAYRRPGSQDVYLFDGGKLRRPDQAEWAWLTSLGAISTELPANHPIWSTLPKD